VQDVFLSRSALKSYFGRLRVNAKCFFHCDYGYVNALQCYVIDIASSLSSSIPDADEISVALTY
jgi:hypothetical protein